MFRSVESVLKTDAPSNSTVLKRLWLVSGLLYFSVSRQPAGSLPEGYWSKSSSYSTDCRTVIWSKNLAPAPDAQRPTVPLVRRTELRSIPCIWKSAGSASSAAQTLARISVRFSAGMSSTAMRTWYQRLGWGSIPESRVLSGAASRGCTPAGSAVRWKVGWFASRRRL